MVYCKLIEKTADSATYSIGTDINDMTGKAIFFRDLREPQLLRQASGDPIRTGHLARIYGKYHNDFVNGNFKEKLAYEIG